MNGVKLKEEDVYFDGNVTLKGNLTLHLGKHLTGAITQVNMFSPALSVQKEQTVGKKETSSAGRNFHPGQE